MVLEDFSVAPTAGDATRLFSMLEVDSADERRVAEADGTGG